MPACYGSERACQIDPALGTRHADIDPFQVRSAFSVHVEKAHDAARRVIFELRAQILESLFMVCRAVFACEYDGIVSPDRLVLTDFT